MWLRHASSSAPAQLHAAAVAIGSNMGNRVANIKEALAMLHAQGHVAVHALSGLYETAPAYVTDQRDFLNAAAILTTPLHPHQLLHQLKSIEVELGRVLTGPRYGPRPVDLDIIFYDGTSMELTNPDLHIPHRAWHERSFVTAPLADLADCCVDDSTDGQRSNDDGQRSTLVNGHTPPALTALQRDLHHARDVWNTEHAGTTPPSQLRRVVPLADGSLWRWTDRTTTMGILNITPDSFSEGSGTIPDPACAVQQAVAMVQQGVDILDVGGQSTRPGAGMLSAQEEVARVMPVLRALQQHQALKNTLVSIDTFYASVAHSAVTQGGAHIVNDVSGGTLDHSMHSTVAALGTPYILMHMRGTPTTMQSLATYTDVVTEVAQELRGAAKRAHAAGVLPWSVILDPGLGFAKDATHTIQLVQGLRRLRALVGGPWGSQPLLVGPSRKRFLGAITGREAAQERDFATAAACALCVQQGANVLRAHHAGALVDAARVADALVVS